MRRRIELFNRGQRVVVSIAVAAGLVAIGQAVETWGRVSDGGWFGYAPGTHAVFVPDGPFLVRHAGLRLLWWLVLIAVWGAVSLWLFRTTPPADPPPPPVDR